MPLEHLERMTASGVLACATDERPRDRRQGIGLR
jgi:hypothetical protein